MQLFILFRNAAVSSAVLINPQEAAGADLMTMKIHQKPNAALCKWPLIFTRSEQTQS